MLRAYLLKGRGASDEAIRLLDSVVNRVPFARERRYVKAALASFKLQRGDPGGAEKISEFRPGEITKVVYLHSLAVLQKKRRAVDLYDELIASESDGTRRGIVLEIGKRFRLTAGTPEHSIEWIDQQEEAALLAEVI